MRKTKSITEIDDYVCTLSDELKELSARELRETKATRDHAIKMLREWAEMNPRIRAIRLDSNFLLRFLRAKKFSVPVTQECIERFLLLKHTHNSEVFFNLDMHLPNMKTLLDLGYMFALPERDHLGRRVIFYRPGVFDMNKFTNADMLKIHGICYETLMANEENQIRGFVHAGVGTGIGLSYMTLFSIKEAVRIAKNAEKNIPMRHKEMHAANVSPAIKFAVDFGMSLLSDKLKKRINFCVDIKRMQIDKKILPKEYGGVMPMAEMIELWKQELEAYRSTILNDDRMTVNLKMYSEKAREGAVSALKQPLSCGAEKESTYGLPGSFRKLEVD